MKKKNFDNVKNRKSVILNNFKIHSVTQSLAHLFTSPKTHPITCSLNHLLIFMLIALSLPVFAFEDALVMTNGKMTDIKIQDNKIIDVFPLITVMNDKNTIIVHPLKEGKTKFSILKNGKEKVIFDVKITKTKTTINEVAGFDILTVDCPPDILSEEFDLDEPPTGFDLDEPPIYVEKEVNR